MNSSAPILLWLRRDLRLSDHPALRAAVDTGRPVLPVYILDEDSGNSRPLGGAARWWLHHSLAHLRNAFKKKDVRLTLRRGRAPEILISLAGQTGAAAVYFTRGYTLKEQKDEAALKDMADKEDMDLRRFTGSLLFEPDAVETKSGGPFKVFTPFYKTCLAGSEPEAPVNAPPSIRGYKGAVPSDDLRDWNLLPTKPDWAGGLRDMWTPGEDAAMDRLHDFLDRGLDDYQTARDIPGKDGTSRLSAHLRFGEISPRRVWHAVRENSLRRHGRLTKSAESFLRELAWREFSYHLLFHWPDLADVNFRSAFDDFPWRTDNDALKAWQKGMTGYPVVDAGMRALWHTGWMHNRVRMITASFLIKDLLIDWREGEAWFRDTLVDADPANNAAGWQWVAGSGADAAPYFRIFNPVTQGKKFDADGKYVRRWVPELKALETRYIHAPWEAPSSALKEAGVTVGKTYPEPIIDHPKARKRALKAYEAIKKK